MLKKKKKKISTDELYNEIDGDLIKLAKKGHFDVIAHGCNCQAIMSAGIAPQMAKAFGAAAMDSLNHEEKKINKNTRIGLLGTVQGWYPFTAGYDCGVKPNLIVVNMYTQEYPGMPGPDGIPLDYTALRMCLRKMNAMNKGLHIGLPKVGCGLAGGDWNIVKTMIQEEFKDCKITVVNYKA